MAHRLCDFGSPLYALGNAAGPGKSGHEYRIYGTKAWACRTVIITSSTNTSRSATRIAPTSQRTFEMIGDPNASASADTDALWRSRRRSRKSRWPQADLRDLDKLNNPMSLARTGEPMRPASTGTAIWTEAKVMSPHMHRCRQQCNQGDRCTVSDDAARHAEDMGEVQGHQPRFELSFQAVRRQQVRIYQDAEGREGTAAALEAWQSAQVDGRLGELLGKTYVDTLLPAAVQDDDGRAGRQPQEGDAAQRIEGNSWMGAATKKAALVKLAKMDVMVGYPDKFRDYSKLDDEADDLYGNVEAQRTHFEWAYQWRISANRSTGRNGRSAPADGRCLQRRPGEQDRLPGRHPPAALFRSEGRRGGELRRHRRDHRPRNHPRLRRPGPKDRRDRRRPRLVDKDDATRSRR